MSQEIFVVQLDVSEATNINSNEVKLIQFKSKHVMTIQERDAMMMHPGHA